MCRLVKKGQMGSTVFFLLLQWCNISGRGGLW